MGTETRAEMRKGAGLVTAVMEEGEGPSPPARSPSPAESALVVLLYTYCYSSSTTNVKQNKKNDVIMF